MKHEVLKAKYEKLATEIAEAFQKATADLLPGRYDLLEIATSTIRDDESIERFEVLRDGGIDIITTDANGIDQSYTTDGDGLSPTDLLFVLEQIETDKINPEEA